MQCQDTNENTTPIATREEIVRLAKRLCQPLNLDELVKRGVLRKAGPWYLLTGTLPHHVLERAIAAKQTARGTYLRFSKPSKLDFCRF